MFRGLRLIIVAAVTAASLVAGAGAAFAAGFGSDGYTPPQGSCQTNGGGGVGAGSGSGGSSAGAGSNPDGSVGPNGQGGVDGNGLPNSSGDYGLLCQ